MFNSKANQNKRNTRREHILNAETPFAVTEAYKSTRTSLMFANTEEGCNIIVFTSSAPGEGKTVTCINMAVTLAESGKKVLVIDSDMRKPQVAASLRLSSVPGLSELLAGVVDMNLCPDCCRQKTEHANLDIIAAGAIPPNPAELISCPRTAKLFERLSKEYDYILIDTPPSLVVTDALLYKDFVMGYVVVVRANRSRSDTAERLVERFNQINARLIGFVLNDRIHKEKSYKRYSQYNVYKEYK